VLVFLDPKVSPKKAKQRISAHLTKRRLTAELILTGIAQHGGCDGADWRKHHGSSKK
jgi:hypothetical protein